MRFRQNIERTGRVLRIGAGIVLLASGAAGLLIAIPGSSWPWRLFQIALILAGAFAILEGAVGWCALRALGIRTRL